MTGSDTVLLGLDIGGTKIGVSVGSADGTVLRRDELPTDPEQGPEPALEQAVERLQALSRDHGKPAALGIAAPGPLSIPEGQLLEVPNMPKWQQFRPVAFLEERLDLPIVMQNDANAGALAEWYWGAAQGADTAVFLTMSTGFGAGLIIGGRLFEGPLGLAGEVGHIRLRDDGPVGFAKRGSAEGFLSGPGIVQQAESERLVFRQSGRHTQLFDQDLTPELVCNAACESDRAAMRVIIRCATELGRFCAILVDLLNPDVIVLGTIGTAHADLFIPVAIQAIKKEALPQSAEHVSLVPSGLTERGHQAALAVARNAIGPPAVMRA